MLSIQMNADSIGYLHPPCTFSDSRTVLPSLSAPPFGPKVDISPCYYPPSWPPSSFSAIFPSTSTSSSPCPNIVFAVSGLPGSLPTPFQ